MSRFLSVSRHFRAVAMVVLVGSLFSCRLGSGTLGAWPPADFRLEVEYATEQAGVKQVRQSLLVTADGLAVYREAEDSVRAADGSWSFPCFRRMCAYQMEWRSVRFLSRTLHDAPVKDLTAPVSAPQVDGVDHTLHFDLTYLGNRVDVVVHNQAVGLMNRVIRIVNRFLPEGAVFTMPSMAGESLEPCLQDVPPATDSLAGALRYHESWMGLPDAGEDPVRAAFALACFARDRRLAARCISRLQESRPEEAASMQRILASLAAEPP